MRKWDFYLCLLAMFMIGLITGKHLENYSPSEITMKPYIAEITELLLAFVGVRVSMMIVYFARKEKEVAR